VVQQGGEGGCNKTIKPLFYHSKKHIQLGCFSSSREQKIQNAKKKAKEINFKKVQDVFSP